MKKGTVTIFKIDLMNHRVVTAQGIDEMNGEILGMINNA